MEGLHKQGKQGKYQFSGGRSGKTGKVDHQKRVLEQQFLNEWFRSESNEVRLSNANAAENDKKENDSQQSENTVRKNLDFKVCHQKLN